MYHKDHIARFVTKLDLPYEEIGEIKERVEKAAKEFSSIEEGYFSGGSLEEVLGKNELVETFREMWEKQNAVLNP
jgi:hypothetical protein